MTKYERDIERESVNAASHDGWFGIKLVPTIMRGLPDRMFIGHGKVVFIEYKNAIGKISALQKRVHKIFAEHGIKVHVARSVDETMRILNDVK
jgi:hypothetical protein